VSNNYVMNIDDRTQPFQLFFVLETVVVSALARLRWAKRRSWW
jgi:hypothetical protein